MISKGKIQEILKIKGIVLEKIATDSRVYDKACVVAYKSIPIPLRWLVGRKKVNRIIDSLRKITIKEVAK